MNGLLDPDGPLDAVDAALLGQLSGLWDRLDPPPPSLVDDLLVAIAVHELDADLAAFQRDAELATVRSTEYERVSSLTFSLGEWSMLVTVTELDASFVRLDGWLSSGDDTEVELRERSRSSTTRAREGRFVFPRVDRGMVQFLVRPPDSRPVITPLVEV